MSKALPLLVPALLLLAACAPTASDAASTTPASTPVQTPAAAAPPVEQAGPPSAEPAKTPVDEPAGASISGAIRDGNRPPPAVRVCATPIGGGTPTCIDTARGARNYRIEVVPGRYHLLGWVRSGELKLIAHASQIRCIQAPCPPDELIEVIVSAGQQRDGIDLNGGYVEIPAGWPQAPD